MGTGLPNSSESIEALVRDLPDPEGARLFFERLTAEQARAAKLLAREEGLLSDVLALAAWSPLLGTTLAQHPDYLSWLARERAQTRVKTTEEMEEALARFALTHSQLDPQMLLARFRRRELLRIYLHDVRRTVSLVETTEELSNLADAVLQHALGLAQQELDNLYGAPQCTDARGRTARASFCVVALGKLGSRELNYASDIDLLFLYSDDGLTAGTGVRGTVTNREYFVKLAERLSGLVGKPSGEGAAYRVDLRLRPYGRDGSLSCSLKEAVRYYKETAQPWELQTLIRARAAAGSAALYANFAGEVRGSVYRPEETVARALSHVRLAKQKIDRHQGRSERGFNVKLGRGGIREIEFIAQALQVAHGGRDEWLRAPHTLISLGRLQDRGYLTERERSALSDAYLFLRRLEHRVQMEHGLQTHLVPEETQRRALLARRMHCEEPGALDSFNRALDMHTQNVSAVFRRIFGATETGASTKVGVEASEGIHREVKTGREESEAGREVMRRPQAGGEQARERDEGQKRDEVQTAEQESAFDVETIASQTAATLLAPYVKGLAGTDEAERAEALRKALCKRARASLNSRRALTMLARVAASLDKSEASLELNEARLNALVELCGASEFFGEMLASNPLLITAIDASTVIDASTDEAAGRDDYHALLLQAVEAEKSYGGELSALRRVWARLLVELGAADVRGSLSLRESNRRQTLLAAASLDAAYSVARRELACRYQKPNAATRLAILGLGRLGSAGMDYGSDLDIVLAYEESAPPPLDALAREVAYGRLSEILVASLSSMTRDGHLYRVDMRLRPDGKNGPVASASNAFVKYLRERADVWEWLAYVKLRAVAGDMEFGRALETEARRAIHEAARRAGPEILRTETRRVRERLERERTRLASRAIDIKFGPGGMLDVYFAVRYLQLRDHVPDEAEDRSTRATLTRLRAAGSLREEEFKAFSEGYALLRRLDHHLRLLLGRSTRLPSQDHPALQDLARSSGFDSANALTETLAVHMRDIRAAYERITT